MRLRKLATALLLAWAGTAAALDFRSVATTAVLYDAPSQKARALFVIAAGSPVEAVVHLDAWVKVRDLQGDLTWIERRHLADKRMLQVRAGGAQVRAAANDSAALVFEAAADVLLEPLDGGSAGWHRVRHRDGPQGFVKVGQVWGQ